MIEQLLPAVCGRRGFRGPARRTGIPGRGGPDRERGRGPPPRVCNGPPLRPRGPRQARARARPIRSGPKREPQWPAGLVGSITHTTGFRAAAVAPRSVVASLGIDTEQNEPLPDGVEELITVPGEPEMLAALARAFPAVHWGRLLFSAKESIYKAWYPLTGRWLGFGMPPYDRPGGHVRGGAADRRRRRDGERPLTQLRGRFLLARGLVATAVPCLRNFMPISSTNNFVCFASGTVN